MSLRKQAPKSRRFSFQRALPATLIGAVAATHFALPAAADPPGSMPCNVEAPGVFCIACTHQLKVTDLEGDRWKFEFIILNWSGVEVHGLNMQLGVVDAIDGPPQIVGAEIDSDGRPIGPGSIPPVGNIPFGNDWPFAQATSGTTAEFGTKKLLCPDGTPIPAPLAFVGGKTYSGLLDRQFDSSTMGECGAALTQMIPGSSFVNLWPSRSRMDIPDKNTVDNGFNVLDGFVIEIDDFDEDESFSLNWQFLDVNAQPIGKTDPVTKAIVGDEYGFGGLNIFSFPKLEEDATAFAPSPTFPVNIADPGRVNSGFTPMSDSDVNADSNSVFLEDEDPVTGIDMFPINPVPVGVPGQGSWIAMEPGAAIVGPFFDPATNPGMGVTMDVGCTNAVTSYCTGKLNSEGCVPTLTTDAGCPSVTGGPWNVYATQVLNNKNGILFHGTLRNSLPFQGGFLCVQPPFTRTAVQATGGDAAPLNNCSGQMSLDLMAQGFSAGQTVTVQAWSRDPSASFSTSLSNGLEVTIQP